jgi:hypothetical protein
VEAVLKAADDVDAAKTFFAEDKQEAKPKPKMSNNP